MTAVQGRNCTPGRDMDTVRRTESTQKVVRMAKSQSQRCRVSQRQKCRLYYCLRPLSTFASPVSILSIPDAKKC